MKGMASPTAYIDLALSRVLLFDCFSTPMRTSPCPISALPLDARDFPSPSSCLGVVSAQTGDGVSLLDSVALQVCGSTIWGSRAFPSVWCEEREGRASPSWQMAPPGQL